MKKQNMKKQNMKNSKVPLLFLVLSLIVGNSQAGTVSLSATGVTSAPIFVTSTLQSLTTGLELYVGTFKNVSSLNQVISTYKAGVSASNASLAQAAAATLYSDTMTWLTSSSNFYSFPANATTITQSPVGATGKVLFTSTATRTVNGVSGTYAGASASMDYTYANYAGGTGAQLWAFYGTGSEIAIVTDSTWVVPGTNSAGLTIGTAQLASSGSGVASELLLANYNDYVSGSDLISSVAVAQTVIPEPSSASLLALGVAGLVALRVRRKS